MYKTMPEIRIPLNKDTSTCPKGSVHAIKIRDKNKNAFMQLTTVYSCTYVYNHYTCTELDS